MIWIFIIHGAVCAFIGIAAGWFSRGCWDKATRKAHRALCDDCEASRNDLEALMRAISKPREGK